MRQRLGDKREMPDVPKPDFVDALAEIWFQINFAERFTPRSSFPGLSAA
jgi:hypothetical protein